MFIITIRMDDGTCTNRKEESMESKDLVRGYLTTLGIEVVSEGEKTFICSNEEEGINNLVLYIDDPILVLEQHIANEKRLKEGYERELLRRNNNLIHGAFILDQKNNICWKDTLRLENLDLNELEGSLKALSICVAENANYFLNQRS